MNPYWPMPSMPRVSEDMLVSLAETLDLERDEVYRQVVNLSLDRWILAPDTVDVLRDCTLLQLGRNIQ